MSFMEPTAEERSRAQANMTAKVIADEPTINQMSQLANKTAKYLAPRRSRRERFSTVEKPGKSKDQIRKLRKKQRQNRRKR